LCTVDNNNDKCYYIQLNPNIVTNDFLYRECLNEDERNIVFTANTENKNIELKPYQQQNTQHWHVTNYPLGHEIWNTIYCKINKEYYQIYYDPDFQTLKNKTIYSKLSTT